MNTKSFLENFWATSQKNELFVCMPFCKEFNPKFQRIRKVAKKVGFDDAKRTQENVIASDIVHEVLDGIANSKTLLFDLSDDPKISHAEPELHNINGNVLYELGIATAIREPEDILIIRETTESKIYKYPFDISHTRINPYPKSGLKGKWLENKLMEVRRGQDWSKSRRVREIAKSIDSVGFQTLILNIWALSPEGSDNFYDADIHNDPKVKLAILRFIDLGMLTFAVVSMFEEVSPPTVRYEFSYHWTPLGRAVIKSLGVEKVSLGST